MADLGFLPAVTRIVDAYSGRRPADAVLGHARPRGQPARPGVPERPGHVRRGRPGARQRHGRAQDAGARRRGQGPGRGGDREPALAHAVLRPDQAWRRPAGPPVQPSRRRGRRHPRQPQPEPAPPRAGGLRGRASAGPGRHRRRGPWHSRGRRRTGRALRPAQRPQGLPAPVGPDRPRRGRRHGRGAGRGRSGPRGRAAATSRRASSRPGTGSPPATTSCGRSRPSGTPVPPGPACGRDFPGVGAGTRRPLGPAARRPIRPVRAEPGPAARRASGRAAARPATCPGARAATATGQEPDLRFLPQPARGVRTAGGLFACCRLLNRVRVREGGELAAAYPGRTARCRRRTCRRTGGRSPRCRTGRTG